MAAGLESGYPVQFSVDYPVDDQDRIRTAFRIILAIPALILLGLVGSGHVDGGTGDSFVTGIGAGGVLALPTALMIIFRQKYPRWWFDWNLELLRFANRVLAYVFLLREEYPSTDEEQAVHLDVPYPHVERDLNRWMPLVKWLLAIPHYIVLFFLYIGVLVVVIIAWFAILFTGKYPPGLFEYVVNVMRWQLRVAAYVFLLTTDRYPPFSLGQ